MVLEGITPELLRELELLLAEYRDNQARAGKEPIEQLQALTVPQFVRRMLRDTCTNHAVERMSREVIMRF